MQSSDNLAKRGEPFGIPWEIVDGKPVPVDGDYGRKIIGIIEAAYASNKSRREEPVAYAK